jgi:hypothetical protein
VQASDFLAQTEAERVNRPRSGRSARQFAVYPPGSCIFFGCQAWEPQKDATAHAQDRDRRSRQYGRWKFRSRRGRPAKCVCGSGRGRIVQRGNLFYCDGCAESGQDHLLPTVSRPPEHKAEPPKPKVKLSQRQARRAKVAGLHGSSVQAVP